MPKPKTATNPEVAGHEPSKFSLECAKLFAETLRGVGLPKSVGEIYGLLYSSPNPLSFSDIVEHLKISKGSASQGLQLLRSLGAVQLAKRFDAHVTMQSLDYGSGFRREYFEPELSLRKLVAGILHERAKPLANAGGNRINRLRYLAQIDPKESEFYMDRLRQLETWRRRLKALLPVLGMMLGPTGSK